MKWFREWQERRRYPQITIDPTKIEEASEDSPTETPFTQLVKDELDAVGHQEQYGYPQLFGADQQEYWQRYQRGGITLAQYKALAQLFYKTKNNQLSPSQVTREYLAIMDETDG